MTEAALKKRGTEFYRAAQIALKRKSHLDFIRHCWSRPEPYVVGRHTRAICAKVDEIMGKLKAGQTTFTVIKVPFRHGKSEILVRNLIPHFMGEFPDSELMLTSYGADLSEDFSRDARTLIRSPAFQELYPDVKLSQESASVSEWRIADHRGRVRVMGLGGPLPGRGYHLGICDDYLRGEVEAMSQSIRDARWNSFSNDFLTRRAPVSATIVGATPRHVDDLIGRIEKAMKDDPEFPRFDFITFPAFSDDYETGTLFPERFPMQWYVTQRATIRARYGEHGVAALLQCEPTAREGGLLKTNKIQYHDLLEFPQYLQWARIWDLAHTEKQRVKADPDYTVGILMAFDLLGDTPHLWIKDVVRVRESAPKRDEIIESTTERDGPYVRVGILCGTDSKDAYETLSASLSGTRSIEPLAEHGDKVVRATPLEALFEAGNVHLPTGCDWTHEFVAEVGAFPRGAHDDQVDPLSGGAVMLGLVDWQPENDAAVRLLAGARIYG